MLFICCFFVQAMDLIFDELRKNSVDIDKNTLSHYINDLLEHHKIVYDQARMCTDSGDLTTIFNHMNVENFGHAMAYLTLVYLMNEPEDVTRQAVRLVSIPLKRIVFTKFKRKKQSFFCGIISYVKHILPV